MLTTERDRTSYAVSAALVAAGLVHLGIAGLSDRPWDGPLSWRKPATFGLSFGTTLATVTWTTTYLRLPARRRTLLLAVFAVDCVVEVLGISIQAWRHVPSHFNTSTPFDRTVAMTLAAGGAVLVAVLGTFAVTAFRGRVDAPSDLRLAVQGGFALLLAGLGAGVAMIAYGTVLVRTGHAAEAYADGGFLKAFHGVTIHGVLVLPALAWFSARRGMAEPARHRLVIVALGAYVTVAAAVLGWSIAAAA